MQALKTKDEAPRDQVLDKDCEIIQLMQVLTQDHRTMEWFGLEGTFKAPPLPLCCHGQRHFPPDQVSQAPSSLALNAPRDGAATAFLDNLCQGLTTCTAKNFFPVSYLTLLSVRIKPFPIVLSLQAIVQHPSPALLEVL